ncbi:hypothetical protein [Flavobacterium sp. YO12]|uniref:DoxX family protein n=1 Tax=Flavobacterium sp. YO12 TaxID=1920029 RepID=UPI00100AFCC1|nr:hypothetical protein [Flavobacterium sp. YO12]RXM47219.1 hypothetical protein BOW55_12390 [Flavobacterium sp. YO12]
MKPLIVLIVVFLVSIFTLKFLTNQYDILMAARIAMCVMLCFTAIAHFVFTKGMVMMLPEKIPFRTELVYATGIIEIVLGICLLISSTKVYAGWILVVFFIFLLPANIYAAIKHIDYQNGTYNGNATSYLWFRIPLQIVFILWTFWCAVLY